MSEKKSYGMAEFQRDQYEMGREGHKVVKDFFVYQGDNPIYRAKADQGRQMVMATIRAMAAVNKSQELQLAYLKLAQVSPEVVLTQGKRNGLLPDNIG